jgi:hypothetical protein
MKRTFIGLITMALTMCGAYELSAQNDPVVDKIIEISRTDNRTMTYVDYLSNHFGGRLLGSDSYENAALWCKYMFEKWGLEVWMQEAGELPIGFNRGPWSGRMIADEVMQLRFATPSYTVGTKGIQRGHVLREPKTRGEFERMKASLKGAWVLIGGSNRGWPVDWSEKADTVRAMKIAKQANGEKVEEPALFYREMVDAGILGIIQAAKVPIQAMYDRTNLYHMNIENLPPVPDIKLDEAQYEIIAKKVDRREYVQLEFDIRNHFRMGPIKYHNVIGVIRGTEYPDEYVIAGGHLDAYDVATGGVDCASGVAPVMEAARLIAEAGGKPKRSILFCLWAGEEFGLYGSKFFVESGIVDLKKIANYFNRDSAPFTPMGISAPEAMYEDFQKVCAPIADLNPEMPFTVHKMTEPMEYKNAGGSDHAHFVMNKVPALSFHLKDPKGYNFDYREIWHTESDLYNKVIPEYEDHASVVTAVVVYGIANLDHLLSRKGLYKTDKK